MKKAPELRFPEFVDEWQQTTVGEVFDFYSTNSYTREDLDNEQGEVKNIHYGDIHMKFPIIVDIKDNLIPRIKQDIDLSRISEDSYCKDGDVVIADASEDYTDIGKAIELKNIGNEKVVAGLHTLLARDNKGITIDGYRGYMFLGESIRKQIKVLAVGAKVLGISKTNINKVILNIPSKQEQKKLARLFVLIDKKIQFQQSKVEALREYKKGVLQKIFSQEIRFKDNKGNNYPEWTQKKLASIIKDKSKGNTPVYVEEGNILLSNEYLEDNNIPIYVQADIDVFNEDILILWDGSQAGKVYTGVSGVLGSTFMKINLKANNCNRFIYQQLKWKLEYIQRAWREGSGVPHVAKDFLQNYKVMVPCYEEQTAISNLLSALDYKIAKEQDKVNQLKEFKQGLLKKMLI